MERLNAILDRCREITEDLTFEEVRRWREAHPQGKVLGHFQVYFPEEIAHAGGILPVKVLGGGNKLEARRADSRIGSFICSICRSSLELGLSGRLTLDAFVTHPICDAARHMAGIWSRNFPGQLSEILYLPQNPNSRASVTYLHNEYKRLKGDLERLLGHPIEDDALRRSTAVYNENRRLLAELYAVKRETPWLLSAVEAYCLVKAGAQIPREEHNLLLREALDLLPQREARPQDKIRVVFEGGFCEQPPLEMIEAIEEMCYIVDDDLLIGVRWLVDDVALEGDPLWNLAYAYVEQSSYSCVQHDLRKPKEEMLHRRMQEARAQAAIITAPKFCEPGLDEQVAYSKHLDHLGFPYLVLEFEEKQSVFEQMKMQVETFAESILFD